MNTTNIDILRQFSAIVNRDKLTRETYNLLLKRWDLDKVDLDEEYIKLQTKNSTLTRSRREAIPEFIRLRNLLKEIEEKNNNSIIMEDEETSLNEVIIGGDFSNEITNQHHVDSNAEIC